MELIDEEGKIFNTINVIDALAILLGLAVVVTGIALVAAPGADDTDAAETDTRYATIDLGTQPDYVANRITTGDTMSRNGHNLTVTDVYATPVEATQEAVTIRARLDGELADGTPNAPPFAFAGSRYRVGDLLSIETDEYAVEGSIQALDAEGADLNTEYVTTEVKLSNVDPNVAAAITEGVSQSSHGEPLVTVQSVTSRPAEVVLESEDGNIYLRDHPVNRDLVLRVELRTIATDSGNRYHSVRTIATDSGNRYHSGPLQVGDLIRLDLGTTTVSGNVTRLDR